MLGTLNTKHKEATVIGGGIAGLLAAYRLGKAGYEVELYEASDRLGGLINTIDTPYGIAESAAHSFRASGEVRALCEELKVPLVTLNQDARSKYILRGGTWRKMPLNPLEFMRMAFKAATVRSDGQPKTFADFATQHLGKPAKNYLITPMCFGIYGTTPDQLMIPAAFPFLAVPKGKTLVQHMLQKKFGHSPAERSESRGLQKIGREIPDRASLVRDVKQSKILMAAPRHGMAHLTMRLSERLESMSNVEIQLNKPINKLPETPNTVLATPASVTAALVRDSRPRLSELLENLTYVSLISATVFIRNTHIGIEKKGLGILIPPSEHYKALGVLFNSYSFEGRVKDNAFSSFTVILGGTPNPDLVSENEEGLREIISAELGRLLNLRREPDHIQIFRWDRAIPLYDRAPMDAWAEAKRDFCADPGRMLAGNYAGSVSIRGMVEQTATLNLA